MHNTIRVLARCAAILLLASAPGTLMAQRASRASQTVTFAVVPIHSPAAALGTSANAAEKVTVGPVSSSGTTVQPPLPAAVEPARSVAARDTRAEPQGPTVITITE